MRRNLLIAAALLIPLLAVSCADQINTIIDEVPRAYIATSETLPGDMPYAPVFLMQTDREAYDRIGSPVVKEVGSIGQIVAMDTTDPAMYFRLQPFMTARGQYANLVYRIHFPEVPPTHLTQGRNSGLFVIITLDEKKRPVLLTTFHTCGCYLAIFPTTFTPKGAVPEDWPADRQEVFGEDLPARIVFSEPFSPRDHIVLTIRSETHRVMNVGVGDVSLLTPGWRVAKTEVRHTTDLKRLPVGGGTTSLFHQEGSKRGLVKGAEKRWEKLLIGWWALDLNVGVDRELGSPAETGVSFYTSLKPWARDVSNPFFFERFLKYWGWDL